MESEEEDGVLFDSVEEEIVTLLMMKAPKRQARIPDALPGTDVEENPEALTVHSGEEVELHDVKTGRCVSIGDWWHSLALVPQAFYYPTLQSVDSAKPLGWKISSLRDKPGEEGSKALEMGMIVHLERQADDTHLRAWCNLYAHTSRYDEAYPACYQWRLISSHPQHCRSGNIQYGDTVYLLNMYYKQFLAVGPDPRFLTTADRRHATAFTIKPHLPLPQSLYLTRLEQEKKTFEQEIKVKFEKELATQESAAESARKNVEARRADLEKQLESTRVRLHADLEATRVDAEMKRKELEMRLQRERQQMEEETIASKQQEEEKRRQLEKHLQAERNRLLEELEAYKHAAQASREQLERELHQERAQSREILAAKETADEKLRALQAELVVENKRLLQLVEQAEADKLRSEKARLETAAEFDGLRMCLVCEEKDRSRRLDPCGHICVCAECSVTAPLGVGGNCPICRVEIQDIQAAFL